MQKYANTQVTFVDAAPDTIKTALSHLGASVNLEINTLSRLLNITSTEVRHVTLRSSGVKFGVTANDLTFRLNLINNVVT